MFRFSIRELMLLTLVVAVGAGWFGHWITLERRNQEQILSADYYQAAYRQWRNKAESTDGLLRQMGFEINEAGGKKSYKPRSAG